MTAPARAAALLVARGRRPARTGLGPVTLAGQAVPAASPALVARPPATAPRTEVTPPPGIPAVTAIAPTRPAPASPSPAVAAPAPSMADRAGPLPLSDSATRAPATGNSTPRDIRLIASPPVVAPAAVPFRAPASGAATAPAAGTPLLERARRAVRPAVAPVPAVTVVTAAATPPNEVFPPPVTGPTADPRAQQARPGRAETAHPPVSIGEIHVHVAEPAPAAADPLALLAPYKQGLTVRRVDAR